PRFRQSRARERPSARPRSGRQIGAHVQIPLGVGDLNALLSKQTPNLIEDLALDVVHAVLRVHYPEAQLELDRGLAEGHDQRVGCRHRQDALRVACRLAHQRERLVDIGIVWDAYRYFKSDTIALMRPIDDLMGDDVLVWNQKLRSVARLHRNIAGAERGDP